MDNNEKHPPSVEQEIENSDQHTKATDEDEIDISTQKMEREDQAFATGSPGESVELEEGTATTMKAEPEYPTGFRFVVLTISLMMGVYLVALDTTIICKPSFPS